MNKEYFAASAVMIFFMVTGIWLSIKTNDLSYITVFLIVGVFMGLAVFYFCDMMEIGDQARKKS